MQTFLKSNNSSKFHDAVKAGGSSNKAVNNILRAGVQPKLKIGAVNDPAEVEADRVADQVMRMPEPANNGVQISTNANSSDINRKCSDCGDKEKLQRKETPEIRMKETSGTAGGHTASAEASSAITSLGSGTPLPTSERAFFEPRFGQDLSHIRVHTGGTADQASQSINARAFSLGNNIAFANGEYQPGTQSGRTLLAHELTHTFQQSGASDPVVQRDLSIEPTHPDAEVGTLSARRLRRAITWNQAAFSDADEIALLRDVLGVSPEPSVIDEDFINALLSYQANYGLTQDGLIGANTARQLANQLRGEAAYPGVDGDAGTTSEMALNPAERRMRLRSRVASRLGRMLHQGFIGPRDTPTGVVTVRSGFSHTSGGAANSNLIGLNYTGTDSANSRWLQFVFTQMSAVDPATGNRAYRTGNVDTTGGPLPYSNRNAFNWGIDTDPGSGMYYEGGGTNERTARQTEIFDQPGGWQDQARAFAASFATRPNRVRLIIGFDTYLVVSHNSVVYHVRWNMYFNFDTSTAIVADVPGSYEVLTASSVNRLPGNRKAVLDTEFPGNTVP